MGEKAHSKLYLYLRQCFLISRGMCTYVCMHTQNYFESRLLATEITAFTEVTQKESINIEGQNFNSGK